MRAFISIAALLLFLVALAMTTNAHAATYQENPPSEKVHLQLSEAVIASGGILWFQGVLWGTQPKSTVLYVEVLNRRQAVWQGIYPIKSGVARGSIHLPDTLASGWYQLRAYTQWMRNAGAAAFFYRPIMVINSNVNDASQWPLSGKDTLAKNTPVSGKSPNAQWHAASLSVSNVQITLDKTSYQPREPLSMKISLPGLADSVPVAVSVRKVNPWTGDLLSNETGDSSGSRSRIAARPNEALKHDAGEAFRYRREDEGLTISGKTTGMDRQAIDRVVVLSIPGKNPYLEYDFTDEEGRFQLPVKESRHGKQAIVLQTADTSLRVQWTLDEKFVPENTYQADALPVVSESALKAVRQSYADRSRIMAQYDLFRTPDSVVVRDETDFRFYGAPNFTIRPEDYIALPNFVEVNRELMPATRLRQSNGRYDLDVFDISTRKFLDGEPSVFMDGVLIHDVSYLVSFPPSEIERIETVNRRTYYGEYRMDGTIAIYTKSGDAYLPALPPSALQQSVRLYSPYQPFSVPDSLAANEPDFRTLLYWQPALTLSRKPYTLDVANADELGEFEVIVEGITPDGRLFHGRQTYTVALSERP